MQRKALPLLRLVYSTAFSAGLDRLSGLHWDLVRKQQVVHRMRNMGCLDWLVYLAAGEPEVKPQAICAGPGSGGRRIAAYP